MIFRLSKPGLCKNQENGSGKQWSLHAPLKFRKKLRTYEILPNEENTGYYFWFEWGLPVIKPQIMNKYQQLWTTCGMYVVKWESTTIDLWIWDKSSFLPRVTCAAADLAGPRRFNCACACVRVCAWERQSVCACVCVPEGDRVRACVCVSGVKLLSDHATNRDQVCFCWQISTRQWANCHGNLSLLSLDRAATVQIHHPTKIFYFSVCSRLGKRKLIVQCPNGLVRSLSEPPLQPSFSTGPWPPCIVTGNWPVTTIHSYCACWCSAVDLQCDQAIAIYR